MTSDFETSGSRCPLCEAAVGAEARKCQTCGEWVRCPHCGGARMSAGPMCQACGQAYAGAPVGRAPVQPTAAAGAPFAYAPQPAMYRPPVKGSPLFAIITLILIFLVFPIGALLTIIGLFTGPRRGCFLAMFLMVLGLFIVSVLVAIVVILSDPSIWEDIQNAMHGAQQAFGDRMC